jgi:hypothetical protein
MITDYIQLFIQIVGLLFIFIVILRLLYINIAKRVKMNEIFEGPLLLVDDASVKIQSEKVNKSFEGTEYSLSFWLYGWSTPENAGWKSDYAKPKGVISHHFSPNVFYKPNSSELLIRIGYLDKEEILQHIEVELPVLKQTWNHTIITLKDRQIDFYSDGVLLKTTYLPYEPWFASKNLYIGEKDNQSLLTIAGVYWSNLWLDTSASRKLYLTQKKDSLFQMKPDNYVKYLSKRFS